MTSESFRRKPIEDFTVQDWQEGHESPELVAIRDQLEAELEHIMSHEVKHYLAVVEGNLEVALHEAKAAVEAMSKLDREQIACLFVMLARQAIQLQAEASTAR